MVTRTIKKLGQVVGVDGDDMKVIAVVFIVAIFLGLLVIILGAFAGVAVGLFELLSGI